MPSKIYIWPLLCMPSTWVQKKFVLWNIFVKIILHPMDKYYYVIFGHVTSIIYNMLLKREDNQEYIPIT